MRQKYLDSLRGIACLIVLLAHIFATDPTFGIYASGCGKIGVWFFMVLSGILLVQTYLEDDNKMVHIKDLPRFYSKKVLRMFPTYLFAIILAIIVGLVGVRDLSAHLLLTSAWGHFWYMPVVIKFYLFAPLVLILLSALKQKWGDKGVAIFFVFITAFGILFCIVFPWNTYIENSVSLSWYVPVFVMGILLAVLMNKLNFQSKIADMIAIFPIVGIVILTPAFRQWIWGAEPSGYLQNKYLYMGLMWCLFIFLVSKGIYCKNFLDKSRVLQKIGDYSYDIYLIHFIVLHKMVAMGIASTWIKGIITIIVSFAIAFILYGVRKKWRKVAPIKLNLLLVIIIWIAGVVVGSVYNEDKNITNSDEVLHEEWEKVLYVPTMISKVKDTYFIVDCWNHRVLYADKLYEDFTKWEVLTGEEYIGGHTVCSDGELLVLDNTDAGNILVYTMQEGKYVNTQIIKNVNGRPHYSVYDENRELFYIIASMDAKIYVYKNIEGYLELVRIEEFNELKGSYVRSCSIIDDKLYTTSGPGCIFEYDIMESEFILANSYPVVAELMGMNQITKIQDYYYITVNTGATGSVAETTIVRTKDLSQLNNYSYEEIYNDMGFVGQPYYITNFDGAYYITEISADKGNGIKRFNVKDNEIEDIETLFYWEDVADTSRERYSSKSANTDIRESVDLFLFAGQSNMAGKGNAKEAPNVIKGYEFRAISDPTQLYSIEEPFGLYENKADGINDTWENMTVLRKEGKGGMVSAFSDVYYRMTGKSVVGVSCSEGATMINQWMPDTDKYADLVERANSAKKYLSESTDYKLENVYIVWCQGESDGDAQTSAEDYYNSLNSLCNTLVEQGVVSHCFIVAIGQNGKDLHLYDEIRAMQLKLCEDNENCTLVSDSFYGMKEAGLMIDEYHYSQNGYNIVGAEAGKNVAIYDFGR